MNVFDELSWRGLVHQVSDADKVRGYFATPGRTAYCGFDPTAPSLHVGNMVPLISLLRLQRAGHRPIFLAGGGTGLIGDPSGKDAERQLQSMERIGASLAKIRAQVERIFGGSVWIENNADWLLSLSAIGLLRDVGKHFTVNWMMAKDSVKTRIAREDVGISYTEFSYMILQAYDFCHLAEAHGCLLQIGGSDQWGNITAGTELIRRKLGLEAFAMTFPLITTADGKKFGKSEKGAIYLDPEMTPPADFHNFWMLTDDRDVIRFMKYFTFLTQEEIGEYERAVAERPELREAQGRLAAEVTRMVHGEEVLAGIERAHAARFGGGASSAEELYAAVRGSAPSVEYAELPDVPQMLVDLGFAPSKGKAKEFLKQGAVKINNAVFSELTFAPAPGDLMGGDAFLLAMGRKKLGLVRLKA
ncbi:Tyrosyl-tRNA synthetase [Desulfovibrio sp. X2]|uniref:tyrosine--tRNA ligase n=1 Tax=Desulfovibrio sp. X2 TaxID=941449 RepID=UPI000358A0E0|nr:tyrosine--tRNA ligase [Desulfovibrio sp. X2]EPR44713.1 Tyrosyl-tRNA synthetase [Desulfovibrio sp. X2]